MEAADTPRLAATREIAGEWPWWRGPARDGHAQTTTLPLRFGTSENVLWKTPVPGRGHSSPIVFGDRVFVTTADERQQTQSVLAFALDKGLPVWQREINRGGFPDKNHPKNTEATPTLACDGERLFATFFHHQQIELTALDLDGQIVWQRVVGPFDPKRYEYGYAPSPLLYDHRLIVSTEQDGESTDEHGVSFLVAYDSRSGDELWRTPRPANISFSSPVVAHVAGRDQVLLSGNDRIWSYDPANGKLLWSVEGTTAATCGTVVWNEQLVFASGGYPTAETLAVHADGSGRIAWKNNQKCYEQSMILVDGYLYAFTDKGVMYCWRADDGQEMWRERLSGPVSASAVYAAGHLFWGNEAGSIYVFKPNPQKFELVAHNRLGDELFASPAVVGESMIWRVAEKTEQGRQEFLYRIAK